MTTGNWLFFSINRLHGLYSQVVIRIIADLCINSYYDLGGNKELDTYSVSGSTVTYTFKNLQAGQRYRIILFKSVNSIYGGSTSATGISNVQSISYIGYYQSYYDGIFCGIGVYDFIPSASEATVELSFNSWGTPSYIGISLFY